MREAANKNAFVALEKTLSSSTPISDSTASQRLESKSIFFP